MQRVKRQSEDSTKKTEESFEKELCKDKDAGEWFRLVAGDGDNCRDVIQCTTSVSLLFYIRFYAKQLSSPNPSNCFLMRN